MTRHEGHAMSEASDQLARRYRRLLWAYPRAYRRERGAEMIDTLLAAAMPGRRRPAARERVNLLRHGLRGRLGRPRSKAIVVIAGLAAVLGGFLGAAGAARASWQGARPLPGNAASATIAQAVLPTAASTKWSRHDDLFFYDDPTDAWTPLFGADDYSPGWVRAGMQSREDHRALIPSIEGRLRDAGWQVTDLRFNEADTWAGARFSAYRDGLALDIILSDATNAVPVLPGMATILEVDIMRDDPWWVVPASVVGGLLGALAGWLLAGWVSRRTQGRHAVLQTGVVLLTSAAFVGMLPAFGMTVLGVALSVMQPTPGPSSLVLWFGLVFLGRLPAVLGVVAALAAIGLAALPRRLQPGTGPAKA
ncbi:MAG TPA: hypothetical protein VGP31_11475 [Planosporangium sp.]|jgi:hypothetical protein|nr:hypothetical protein [Planosporangium sp.]